MAKNEMKTTKVMIMIMMMIMLNFAQADYNSSIVQIGPNIVSSKYISKCAEKCSLYCAPLLLTIIGYPICLLPCNAKCPKKPTDVVDNCIIGCGLTKSIDINTDARGLAAYVVDSCLQKCQNK
ncbi:hypothetical protein CR513_13359, partial [Mucuna pruriens]